MAELSIRLGGTGLPGSNIDLDIRGLAPDEGFHVSLTEPNGTIIENHYAGLPQAWRQEGGALVEVDLVAGLPAWHRTDQVGAYRVEVVQGERRASFEYEGLDEAKAIWQQLREQQ